MAKLPSTTAIQVESIVFPPSVKPPGTTNTLFLGGAGVRRLDIDGELRKIAAVSLYLEDKAVQLLATKWKGKSADELNNSVDFYNDIGTGHFERFIKVTFIYPITGKQFSEKVTGNYVEFWKAQGTYTDEEAKTIVKFLEAFKDPDSPLGSVLFTLSRAGSVSITFSKDGTIPETVNAVFDNEKLGHPVFNMLMEVSPETKKSLASNLSRLMN